MLGKGISLVMLATGGGFLAPTTDIDSVVQAIPPVVTGEYGSKQTSFIDLQFKNIAFNLDEHQVLINGQAYRVPPGTCEQNPTSKTFDCLLTKIPSTLTVWTMPRASPLYSQDVRFDQEKVKVTYAYTVENPNGRSLFKQAGDVQVQAVTAGIPLKQWETVVASPVALQTLVHKVQESEAPLWTSGNDRKQMPGFVSVAMGEDFICGIVFDQKVFCAGKNLFGQLGNGKRSDKSDVSWGSPVLLQTTSGVTKPLERVVQLHAFAHSACAVYLNSTNRHRVACWGKNDTGQLGQISSQAPSSYAQTVDSLPSDVDVVSLALSRASACVATLSHGTKCWGLSDHMTHVALQADKKPYL